MAEIIVLRVDDGCIPDRIEELRQLNVMCDIELRPLEGRIFYAHRIILCARCNYFSTMLSSSFQEAKQPVIEIDESAEMLEELIRYIYSGVVQITGDTAQDFLRVGNQYNMQALFLAVENYITENIDVDNCVPLIRTARQLNAKKLERGALEFVEKNLKIVSKFDQMDKEDVYGYAMIWNEEFDFHDIFLQFLSWLSVRVDEETVTDIFRQWRLGRLSKQDLGRMIQVSLEPRENIEKVAVEKVKESFDCRGLPGQSSKKSGFSHPLASYCGSLDHFEMESMNYLCSEIKFFVIKDGDNDVFIRNTAKSETCFVFVSRGTFATFTYFHFTAKQPWCELTLQDAGTDSSPCCIYLSTCDIPKMNCTPKNKQTKGKRSLGNLFYTPKNCRRGCEVAVQDVSYRPKTQEKEILVTCKKPLRNGRHGLLIIGHPDYQPWKFVKWHEFEQQEASSEGLKAKIFSVKFVTPNYQLFSYALWEISD